MNKKVSVLNIMNILIVIQLLFSLFSGILVVINPLFSVLFYLSDFLNLLLLIFMFTLWFSDNKKIIIKHYEIIWFTFFVFYSIVSFFWSDYNFYGAFSRLRYILGMFIFYICCRNFLKINYYRMIIRLLCIVQVINAILVFYQNQMLNLHPDFCNGIFGTGYANGIEGTFCLAFSVLSFVNYLTGNWKLYKVILLFTLSSTICALAEIKIYFVIFIICSVVIVFFQKRSFKEYIRLLLIIIAVVITFLISYRIIQFILPDNLGTFFSIDKSLSYEKRTTFAGRTNTIPFIFNNVFHKNIFTSLFGEGLGECSKLFIYELGKSFSDFGFLGLLFLFSFFISLFVKILRTNNYSSQQLFVSSFSIGIMISVIVWNAVFIPSAYFVFFFLSVHNFYQYGGEI